MSASDPDPIEIELFLKDLHSLLLHMSVLEKSIYDGPILENFSICLSCFSIPEDKTITL